MAGSFHFPLHEHHGKGDRHRSLSQEKSRAPAKYKDLKAFGKVDLILVTHGHMDHIGDLPELAKLTGATVVANHELARNLVSLGFLDGGRPSS